MPKICKKTLIFRVFKSPKVIFANTYTHTHTNTHTHTHTQTHTHTHTHTHRHTHNTLKVSKTNRDVITTSFENFFFCRTISEIRKYVFFPAMCKFFIFLSKFSATCHLAAVLEVSKKRLSLTCILFVALVIFSHGDETNISGQFRAKPRHHHQPPSHGNNTHPPSPSHPYFLRPRRGGCRRRRRRRRRGRLLPRWVVFKNELFLILKDEKFWEFTVKKCIVLVRNNIFHT